MTYKRLSKTISGFHKNNAKCPYLDIVLRTCSRVESIHGGDRPFGMNKRQVTLCTIQSLLNSMTDQCALHIIDDHSAKEDVAMMKRLLKKHDTRHKFISLDVTGNGASLEACFKYAREQNFNLIYFVEDDYWHLPEAIPKMLEFYDQFEYDCIIHPTDYYDRYSRPPYESLLFLGKDRHWRTLKHTTGTFLISKRILDTHWKKYIGFATHNKKGWGGENKTINKVYEKEVCLSPIPSLAAHISPDPPMPPFVDWEALSKQLLREIG